MSIKQNGGVFGRNPTFNDVTIEGELTFDGDIDINSDLKIDGNLDVDGTATMDSLTIGQSTNFSNALANDLQVGTTSGSHGITIVGQNNASANLFFADNNNTDVGKISYSHASDALSFTVATEEAMRISASGALLVGTSNTPNGTSVYGAGLIPSSNDRTQLHMATSSTADLFHIRFYNPNGSVGDIRTNGSATEYNTSSDQRLKENIADADDSGTKVDAIQVRKFDWKADGEHQDYGMIAQELQTVAPEAVSGDADSDEMMGVDYSKLVPMLIKEIQSLRQRVASLEE